MKFTLLSSNGGHRASASHTVSSNYKIILIIASGAGDSSDEAHSWSTTIGTITEIYSKTLGNYNHVALGILSNPSIGAVINVSAYWKSHVCIFGVNN